MGLLISVHTAPVQFSKSTLSVAPVLSLLVASKIGAPVVHIGWVVLSGPETDEHVPLQVMTPEVLIQPF